MSCSGRAAGGGHAFNTRLQHGLPLLVRAAPSPAPDLRQRLLVVARSAGGNVLERNTGTAQRPQSRRRRPPIYRVLLHNDDFNKREYVVRVLMKVVQVSVDEAVNIMREADISGLALVTMAAQEAAEEYCEGLRAAGLISTMEPAGP